MADYEGVLADLKVRRAALDQERTALETAIGAIERLLLSAGQATRQGVQADIRTVSPRAFIGLTMPQAITKYLKQVREPQAKSQIRDALRSGGMRMGPNVGAHIYNTLHRLSQGDGPYRRESDGRWSLREWPPVSSGNSENISPQGSATH
jgi:hypothetical protein